LTPAYYRANQASFNRKYAIFLEEEANLGKELQKIIKEKAKMEAVLKERIANLEFLYQSSTFKIETLHSALEKSVPMEDHLILNRKMEELAIKYTDILQTQKDSTKKLIEARTAIEEREETKKKIEELNLQLEISMDKVKILEKNMEEMSLRSNESRLKV
jgi:hypothetical protein